MFDLRSGMRGSRRIARSLGVGSLLALVLLGPSALPGFADTASVLAKLKQVEFVAPQWIRAGGDASLIATYLTSVHEFLAGADPVSAERTLDELLAIITAPSDSTYVPPPGPYLGRAVRVTLGTVPATAAIIGYMNGQIYVLDQDGGQLTQITFSAPRIWEHVAMSHDRRYIVANDHPATNRARSRLWLYDLVNGTQTQVLPQFYVAGDGGVAWDTRGYMYFAGRELSSTFTSEIFRIKPDGTGLARLTYSPGFSKYDVGVSEDGSAITYVVVVPDPIAQEAHTEIWVSNADGSDPRRVYTAGLLGVQSAHDPELSPDNARVVFSVTNSGVPGNYPDGPNTAQDLWTVLLNGTGLRRLTPPGPISILPSWQPNGNLIVYTEASEFDTYTGAAIVNSDRSQAPVRIRHIAAAKWIPLTRR